MAIAGALGIGLSSCIFLPAVLGYLGSVRNAGMNFSVPLLYDMETYKNMFYTLFIGKELHRSIFALPIIGILAMIVAISTKEHYAQKIAVACCGIGYIFPIFSWIGTGFSNTIYDRWEIVLIIAAALVFVSEWEQMKMLTNKNLICIIIFYVGLVFLGFYSRMFTDRCYRNMFLAFSGCIIIFGLEKISKRFCNEKRKEFLLVCLTLGCIALTWWTMVDNYPISRLYNDNPVSELISDEAFYRIENENTFMNTYNSNISMTQNYYSTAEYLSICNPIYINALNDEWNICTADPLLNRGLDRRAVLETISGVKYIMLKTGHEYLAPYGFEYYSETNDGKWKCYENAYVLPIAYTYDKVFDFEKYEKATVIEKQFIMSEAAALEDYEGKVNEYSDVKYSYTMENCVIESISDEKYQKDIYTVKDGKKITLHVPVKENCENYLYVNDKEADGLRSIGWNDTSLSLKMRNDRENLINLGYSKYDGEFEVVVLTDAESNIVLENIVALHYSMENYPTQMQKMKEETLQNVQISANKIQGDISVSGDRILCTTIPYMPGWHAAIDGKSAKTYKSNSMFLAIELTEGVHKIEFSYQTPGLRVGVLITITSLLILAVWYKKERA